MIRRQPRSRRSRSSAASVVYKGQELSEPESNEPDARIGRGGGWEPESSEPESSDPPDERIGIGGACEPESSKLESSEPES